MTRKAGAAPAAAEPVAGAPAPDAGAPGAVMGSAPLLAAGERVLLLGIGNDLRGDDAAGPRVAQALDGRVTWDLRAVHGLTPELADDLAGCDVVLFVDAAADPTLERPGWKHHHVRRGGAPATPVLGHALDVPGLLDLSVRLHGGAPRAATLALPARDFALGETLTPEAAAGVEAAVAALLALSAASSGRPAR